MTAQTQSRAQVLAPLRLEAAITVRMMATNLIAALVPMPAFGLGVCSYAGLSAGQTAWRMAEVLALAFLFQYIFDASNQGFGSSAGEDRLNKPHRPVPAGLVTSAGLVRRFYASMVIYLLLGVLLGAWQWVLLWQVTVWFNNVLVRNRQHYYVYYKQVCMMSGTAAQLAATWQVITPLNGLAWRWILAGAVFFMLPLPFEDLRDTAGDRAIGRRTLVSIVGHWPTRLWFAATLGAVPLILHFLVYRHTGASPDRVAGADALAALSCLVPVVTSLAVRNQRTDAITYQLYTLAYVMCLAASWVLWL